MDISYTPSVGRQGHGLTTRERQVIALVAAGYTDRDLAQKLGMRENTARNHLIRVFDKLGVANRLELLLFAFDQGLTKEDES